MYKCIRTHVTSTSISSTKSTIKQKIRGRPNVLSDTIFSASNLLPDQMFALPGNGLNLKAFFFTDRVVGYQQSVVESV